MSARRRIPYSARHGLWTPPIPVATAQRRRDAKSLRTNCSYLKSWTARTRNILLLGAKPGCYVPLRPEAPTLRFRERRMIPGTMTSAATARPNNRTPFQRKSMCRSAWTAAKPAGTISMRKSSEWNGTTTWSICPDDSRKRARALRVRRRSEQAAKKAYSGYGLVSESILLSLRATSPIKAAQMITKTRMIEPATTTGLFILGASMAKVSIAAKL